MNRLLLFMLMIGMGCSTLQAIDLHNDKACEQLKVAIEQAQPIEKIQAAWKAVTAGLSAQNKKIVAAQAVEHARAQKAALEKAQVTLGNKTYDASKLKWAAAQLAGIAYCVGSPPLMLLLDEKFNLRSNHEPLIRQIIGIPLLPIIGLVVVGFENRKLMVVAVAVELCLRLYFTIYWANKGCKNLYQGMNAKKLIEQKVSNLEATIAYLQPLSGQANS